MADTTTTNTATVGAKRFFGMFTFNREARRLRAKLEEKEKELEEAKKTTEEPEPKSEPKAEPEAEDEKVDSAKAEEVEEPKPETAEAKTGAEKAEPKAEEPEPKPEPKAEKEFNVEEHLDEFFWYLKAHPIYTRMLLSSSEALSAKSVAVFFNRFTDPKHERMLTKKDIKETVKKNFGGDLEKACAEHGGWFDREYRVADEKGNPTGERMPDVTTTTDVSSGDDSSGAD